MFAAGHVELCVQAQILDHQDVRVTMEHFEDLQAGGLRTKMDRGDQEASYAAKDKRPARSQRAS